MQQLGPEYNAELQGPNFSSSSVFQPKCPMFGRSDPGPKDRAQHFWGSSDGPFVAARRQDDKATWKKSLGNSPKGTLMVAGILGRGKISRQRSQPETHAPQED